MAPDAVSGEVPPLEWLITAPSIPPSAVLPVAQQPEGPHGPQQQSLAMVEPLTQGPLAVAPWEEGPLSASFSFSPSLPSHPTFDIEELFGLLA